MSRWTTSEPHYLATLQPKDCCQMKVAQKVLDVTHRQVNGHQRLVPGGYIPTLETKQWECWKWPVYPRSWKRLWFASTRSTFQLHSHCLLLLLFRGRVEGEGEGSCVQRSLSSVFYLFLSFSFGKKRKKKTRQTSYTTSLPFLLSTTAAPLLRSVEQERKRSKLRLRYNVQWSCVLARNLDLIFHFFFLRARKNDRREEGKEGRRRKEERRGRGSSGPNLLLLPSPFLLLSSSLLRRLRARGKGERKKQTLRYETTHHEFTFLLEESSRIDQAFIVSSSPFLPAPDWDLIRNK